MAPRKVIAQAAASPTWSVTGRIAFVRYYDQYAKPVRALHVPVAGRGDPAIGRSLILAARAA